MPAFALLLAAIASARDSQPAKDGSMFDLAFPPHLHAIETLHRTRVRTVGDGSQTEVIDQTTDLLLTSLPKGGWQLVETLVQSSDTRNGASAPDILSEMLKGMPIAVAFDPEGRVVSVTGYEPLKAHLAGLAIPAELRPVLDKVLDPAVLGARLKADVEERFGALTGRPTKIGSAFGVPGPNGALAEWTVTDAVACPPGECLQVDFHYPLAAGTMTLGAGISADVTDGTVTGSLAIDPKTGLSWSEGRTEQRNLTMDVGGKKSSGVVTDQVERTWALVE
jgi:hypothetical protein